MCCVVLCVYVCVKSNANKRKRGNKIKYGTSFHIDSSNNLVFSLEPDDLTEIQITEDLSLLIIVLQIK